MSRGQRRERVKHPETPGTTGRRDSDERRRHDDVDDTEDTIVRICDRCGVVLFSSAAAGHGRIADHEVK